VWTDAENQWLATGAIIQGFASLLTLVILVWSVWNKRSKTTETKLDQLLADLSHSQPLQRLVAIRQLTRLLVSNRLSSDYYLQSIEYFQLMLSEPQLPVVKNALLESLDLLDAENITRPKRPQVRIPLQIQHSHQSMTNRVLQKNV
jgi:hypothetical protein